MRLIGILTGGALATVILVAVLGTPVDGRMDAIACKAREALTSITAAVEGDKAVAAEPGAEKRTPVESRQAPIPEPATPAAPPVEQHQAEAVVEAPAELPVAEPEPGESEESEVPVTEPEEASLRAARAMAKASSRPEASGIDVPDQLAFENPGLVRTEGLPDAEGEAPAGDDVLWYPFWKPFYTEISARGFARRLETQTGLDYRVSKQGPGEYVVALSHTDEAELAAGLARIEAATGLDLQGGR